MARNLAALRSNVESALAGRIPAPFTYRDRKLIETVSTGVPEIDSLAGGLPRGGLTEICGPPCAGRTSLLVSALASRTAHAEVCALVDGRDAFDPHSAEAAGVALKQLLWVRCRNIDQALRATDLLLQGGGFGLIALDLSDIPPETVRYVPLNAWFRFRRAVEDTPTILVLLEQESNAKTCASLVLQLGAGPARWSMTLETRVADSWRYPPACLLDGFQIRAEVLRSRIQPANETNFHHGIFPGNDVVSKNGAALTAAAGSAGIFETKAMRSYAGTIASCLGSPPTGTNLKTKSKGRRTLR